MRIAIDALGIDSPGGGRTSILNLLKEIFILDALNEYTVFLSQHEPSLNNSYPNVKFIIIPLRNRFIVRIIAQIIIVFTQHQYDLIHCTKNLGFWGVKKPTIVTVHDLTTILFPSLVPKIDHFYWKVFERLTLEKAAKIITVSDNAAKDIENIYGINPKKIVVVYHGCSSTFNIPKQEIVEQVKTKYNLPDYYYLHVGRIDKKKNLSLLLKAFIQLINIHNFPGKLVLVGQVYKKSPDLVLSEIIYHENISEKIIFTGVVPYEDLPAIYNGAVSCVYPSIHEGFGLVAIEAMACGSPLIACKAGALEEIVGDGGIVLSECSETNLVNAMKEVFVDESFRNRLITQGYNRVKNFTWRDAALKTLDIYKHLGDIN